MTGIRTAVLAAAVLSLPAADVAAQVDSAKSPVSIGVWLYDFAGENDYLARTKAAFEQQSGHRLEIYTHAWADYGLRTEQWLGPQIRYAPDMMIIHDYDLPLAAGRATSLEGRLPGELTKHIPESLMLQGQLERVQLAVPWLTAPWVLYYRSDILAEAGLSPPTTLDELKRAACELADPPNVYGLGLPGVLESGAPDAFMAVFRALGGLLFDDTGRLDLSGNGLAALSWWAETAAAGGTQPEVLSWPDVELVGMFMQGRVAMIVERPWVLRELMTHPAPPEIGVAPMPKAEGGLDHLSTDCVFILETARDVDACLEFIELALSREQQRDLAGLGVPSVRDDVRKSLPDDPRWEPFVQAIQNGCGAPPDAWTDVAPLTADLLAYTLSGRLTPREAIDAIGVQVLSEPEAARLRLESR